MKLITRLGFALLLLIPVIIPAMAQDTSTGLSLLDALALLREAYGEDVVIREIEYDAADDEDDDDTNDVDYWKFELVTGEEIRISVEDGTLVEDMDDDSMDDNGTDDSMDDNSDDDSMDDNSDDDSMDDDSMDDSSDDDNLSDIVPTATIEDILAKAELIYPGSTVLKIELEDEDGYVVWKAVLDNGREILIDIEDGDVLAFGYEGNVSMDDDDDDDRDDDRDDDDSDSDDDRDDDSDDDDDDDSDDDDDDDSDDDDDDDSDDDGDDD